MSTFPRKKRNENGKRNENEEKDIDAFIECNGSNESLRIIDGREF